MGAKKKNNNNNNEGGDKKKGGDGGEKKEDNPITVVLKIDMHCEGCASKIVKCVKGFDGVHTVKPESGANKLTVVGKVDPTQLRDKLADKTKKKVDLVSPQPKKDKADKDGGGNDNKKENKDGGNDSNKADDDNKKKKPEKANDDKKPKEPPVTTAVLKLSLHCQGCVEKIRKTITKTKGYHDMELDRQKELVTVKGTMDMKALAETLKEKLKRPVEIVPPKKDKEKDKDKDKEGGENGGGNGENGGGKKKKNKGEGGGDGGGENMEGHMMEYLPGQLGYGQAPYVYGSGYGYGYPPPPPPVYIGGPLHAPQMFSDENPNACSVM